MPSRPLVVILTYCRKPENLYGSLLTFKTLRTGFPDADVLVVDNVSHPSAIGPIQEAARSVSAEFLQLDKELIHHDFIRQTLAIEAPKNRPLVFADPDLLFWEKINIPEGDYDVAGRKLPAFQDPYSGTYTEWRLHTSLLLIPSPARLLHRINEIELLCFEMDTLRPIMFPEKNALRRFDTFGVFCNMAAEYCHAFSERELDRYDHIFCGSDVKQVSAKLDKMGEMGTALFESHQKAKSDYTQLKGIWRQQEQWFRSHVSGPVA